MHVGIDLGSWSQLVVAVVLTLIALVTLQLGPRVSASRVFAAFLMLVAANFFFNFLSNYFFFQHDLDNLVVVRRLADIFLALDPAYFLWLAAIFPRRMAWTRRWFAPLSLLPGVGLAAAAVIVDPSALGASQTPYAVVRELYLISYYLAGYALIAHAFLHEQDPARRRLQALLTIAAGTMVIPRAAPLTHTLSPGGEWGPEGILAAALVFVVAAVALLITGRAARPVVRVVIWTGALILVITGTWIPALFIGGNVSFVFSSRWLVFAGLVSYAILRHQLFDIDVRLATGASWVAAGAVVIAAFFVGREIVLGVTPELGTALANIIALGAAALAVYPAIGLARGTRGALRPDASNDDGYLARRKMEVYGLALAAALEEGRTPDTDRRLARLRRDLDLDEIAHRRLVAMAETEARIGQNMFAAFRRGALVADRYRVADQIGAGRQSRTYRARDERTGQDVVLKELRPEWLGDDEVRSRFRLEGDILATASHAHLVRVQDRFEAARSPCIVMEYCAGGSVQDALERSPLSPPEAVRVTSQVLDALGALHDMDVLHRDVKPANVLFDANGAVRLGDLGVAHLAAPEEATIASGAASQPGTVAYMSPEQARGVELDVRSDLYAAGALLYTMMTGRTPIDVSGCTEFEARERIQNMEPDWTDPAIPVPLRAFLRKAMAKRPEQRYASARTMGDALARWSSR